MPPPRLEAGELRHPIDITRVTRTPDGAGGWTQSYVKVAHTRGFIRPLRGRELVDYQQIDSRIDISITMRFNPGFRVTPQMQIAYLDGYGVTHTYLVHAVLDDQERHRILTVMCEERHVS